MSTRILIHLAVTAAITVLAPCRVLSSQQAAPPQLSGAAHFRLVERARSFLRSGDTERAIAAFDSACVNAAFDPRLWTEYAGALEWVDRHIDAIRALERATTLGAAFGASLEYRVARNFSRAGVRDSALVWLDLALQHRFEGRARIADDSAFATLRADPPFMRIAGLAPAGAPRDEGWRRDIDFLVAEAKRLHVGLDRAAFSDNFSVAARRLRDDVGNLNDDRIRLELRGLLVRLGDGHTDIQHGFSRLPVDFYYFSDGLFIVRGVGVAQELVGARVLALGSLSAEQAMREVARYVPRDNDMGVLLRGAVFLGQPIVLQAIGAARDTTGIDLVIRDRGGRTRAVRLSAIGRAAPLIGLRAPAGAGSPPPLYLSDTTPVAPAGLDASTGAMWFRALGASRALYLQYNAVAHLPNRTTSQFAESLKATLRRERTRHLIVDVRNNGGGNTFLYPPLLDAIIHFRESAADHRVWVIIGRRTFSAAQNFATTLERYVADVTFVGEPTGSRPNFVGESTPVVLPYSRLRIAISSRYHQNVDFTDRRMWIAPQVPTPLSSVDYFANRDPAVNAILELIGAAVTGGTDQGAMSPATGPV